MMQHLSQRVIGLVILLAMVYVVGCTGPQVMTPPSVAELPTAHAARVEHEGLVVQATVLTAAQAQRLLGVHAAARAMVPVLFVLTNHTAAPYTLLREHFALSVNQRRYAPLLPGRAVTLLRDSSGSQGAALAGVLALGIFAAPVIDAAEKQEAAAVVANQTIVFAQANIPADGAIAGYLFFEVPLAEAFTTQALTLELQVSPDSTSERLAVALINPYTH